VIYSHEGYERAISRRIPQTPAYTWWACGLHTGHKLPAAFEDALELHAAHVGEKYFVVARLPKEKPYSGLYVIGAVLSAEDARLTLKAISQITNPSASRIFDGDWAYASPITHASYPYPSDWPGKCPGR
jgi:hypothetical protein